MNASLGVPSNDQIQNIMGREWCGFKCSIAYIAFKLNSKSAYAKNDFHSVLYRPTNHRDYIAFQVMCTVCITSRKVGARFSKI